MVINKDKDVVSVVTGMMIMLEITSHQIAAFVLVTPSVSTAFTVRLLGCKRLCVDTSCGPGVSQLLPFTPLSMYINTDTNAHTQLPRARYDSPLPYYLLDEVRFGLFGGVITRHHK